MVFHLIFLLWLDFRARVVSVRILEPRVVPSLYVYHTDTTHGRAEIALPVVHTVLMRTCTLQGEGYASCWCSRSDAKPRPEQEETHTKHICMVRKLNRRAPLSRTYIIINWDSLQQNLDMKFGANFRTHRLRNNICMKNVLQI